MFEQPTKEEILSIIKEIEADPTATQRALSQKLGISLGKTNYLLKELINKGLIKAAVSLSGHPSKAKKVHYYHLTKKGVELKLYLMYHFLKRKELEYNRLKQEWDVYASMQAKRGAI